MNMNLLDTDSFSFIPDLKILIIAAFFAFIITWLITSFLHFRSVVKNMPAIREQIVDLKNLIDEYRTLFPIEIFEYKGVTFRRGMHVKLTLIDKKSFVGSFVGGDSNNKICIITRQCIVTPDLGFVEELVPLENGEKN